MIVERLDRVVDITAYSDSFDRVKLYKLRYLRRNLGVEPKKYNAGDKGNIVYRMINAKKELLDNADNKDLKTVQLVNKFYKNIDKLGSLIAPRDMVNKDFIDEYVNNKVFMSSSELLANIHTTVDEIEKLDIGYPIASIMRFEEKYIVERVERIFSRNLQTLWKEYVPSQGLSTYFDLTLKDYAGFSNFIAGAMNFQKFSTEIASQYSRLP